MIFAFIVPHYWFAKRPLFEAAGPDADSSETGPMAAEQAPLGRVSLSPATRQPAICLDV
jgi:hypothetical protein